VGREKKSMEGEGVERMWGKGTRKSCATRERSGRRSLMSGANKKKSSDEAAKKIVI